MLRYDQLRALLGHRVDLHGQHQDSEARWDITGLLVGFEVRPDAVVYRVRCPLFNPVGLIVGGITQEVTEPI